MCCPVNQGLLQMRGVLNHFFLNFVKNSPILDVWDLGDWDMSVRYWPGEMLSLQPFVGTFFQKIFLSAVDSGDVRKWSAFKITAVYLVAWFLTVKSFMLVNNLKIKIEFGPYQASHISW